MKIVKLNRRFKQFKENGHTVALRFNGWSKKASAVESVCRDRLGGGSWNREGNWCSYFGERGGRLEVRPYWITFRNEKDLTLVLLSANLTQNG
mgnify:CR=1 FL=1